MKITPIAYQANKNNQSFTGAKFIQGTQKQLGEVYELIVPVLGRKTPGVHEFWKVDPLGVDCMDFYATREDAIEFNSLWNKMGWIVGVDAQKKYYKEVMVPWFDGKQPKLVGAQEILDAIKSGKFDIENLEHK